MHCNLHIEKVAVSAHYGVSTSSRFFENFELNAGKGQINMDLPLAFRYCLRTAIARAENPFTYPLISQTVLIFHYTSLKIGHHLTFCYSPKIYLYATSYYMKRNKVIFSINIHHRA